MSGTGAKPKRMSAAAAKRAEAMAEKAIEQQLRWNSLQMAITFSPPDYKSAMRSADDIFTWLTTGTLPAGAHVAKLTEVPAAGR